MKNEVNDFIKLVHAVGAIFAFLIVGGLIIDGKRQGDYTFPIFLILVLFNIVEPIPIKQSSAISQP